MAKEYRILDVTTAAEYAGNHPALASVFGDSDRLVCREIGDGNLNRIFVVRSPDDPERSVILKQALPYIRRYPQHRLTRERGHYEALYYQFCEELCSERIPRFFAHDEGMALVIMENLDHHVVLRKGLVRRERYPELARHMGHFLAAMLYSTSDFHLESTKKKELVKRFINPELCEVTERAVFTAPYMATYELNRWNRLLDPLVSAIREDQRLKAQVMELKCRFMTCAQALLHGDLHTGSIMVNEHDTRVIDPEFCFFGPMGFDVGALLGNYILNWASQEVRIPNPDERANYRQYLLELMGDTWHTFRHEFEAMWLRERHETTPPDFCKSFMLGLLRDSAGYAGCKIIRRIIGSAHVEDMDGIEDLEQQARAMNLGLCIGRRLVSERNAIGTIEDVLSIVSDSRPAYPLTDVHSRGRQHSKTRV